MSLTSTTSRTTKGQSLFTSGQRWGQVYNYLNNTGVNATAGRSPNVGVGSLMLGGGMPYFSSLHGIVSDGAQEYEIILANSPTARVHLQLNPDLFEALKGGDPNFGIVTKSRVDANPSTDLWFEAKIYSPNQITDLSQALVNNQAAAENSINANLFLFIGNENTLVASSTPRLPGDRWSTIASNNIPSHISFIKNHPWITSSFGQSLFKRRWHSGSETHTRSASFRNHLNSYE